MDKYKDCFHQCSRIVVTIALRIRRVTDIIILQSSQDSLKWIQSCAFMLKLLFRAQLRFLISPIDFEKANCCCGEAARKLIILLNIICSLFLLYSIQTPSKKKWKFLLIIKNAHLGYFSSSQFSGGGKGKYP